jgi:hypothetical protein
LHGFLEEVSRKSSTANKIDKLWLIETAKNATKWMGLEDNTKSFFMLIEAMDGTNPKDVGNFLPKIAGILSLGPIGNLIGKDSDQQEGSNKIHFPGQWGNMNQYWALRPNNGLFDQVNLTTVDSRGDIGDVNDQKESMQTGGEEAAKTISRALEQFMHSIK